MKSRQLLTEVRQFNQCFSDFSEPEKNELHDFYAEVNDLVSDLLGLVPSPSEDVIVNDVTSSATKENIFLLAERAFLTGLSIVEENLTFKLENKAKLYHNLGVIYKKQEKWDAAESAYNKALRLIQPPALTVEESKEGPKDTGSNYLTDGFSASLAPEKNTPDYPANSFISGLATDQRPHALAAKTNFCLGLLYVAKGDPTNAKPFYQESLRIHRAIYAFNGTPALINTARKFYDIAKKAVRDKNLEEAAAFLNEAIQIRAAISRKEDHYDTCKMYNQLGLVYLAKGELMQAEACFLSVFNISRDLCTPMSFVDQVVLYNNLAVVSAKQGKTESAKYYFETATEIANNHIEKIPQDDPDVTVVKENLSKISDVKQTLYPKDGISTGNPLHTPLLEKN